MLHVISQIATIEQKKFKILVVHTPKEGRNHRFFVQRKDDFVLLFHNDRPKSLTTHPSVSLKNALLIISSNL